MEETMQQSNIQTQKQEQKLREQKSIKQRQEQADLYSQQMAKQSISDSPNALESSTLMLQKADFSELLRSHRIDEVTGIDAAMLSSEFKIESAKSKARFDVLRKQSGLKGQMRSDYINEYLSFIKQSASLN